MSHNSVAVPNSVEFINIETTEVSPLISKCEIKVCYVGDEPNRNKSVITKEVATKMAASLRGCPIVGFYNDSKKDFEEHNRVIDLSNGQFEIKDTTRPYGFVSTEAEPRFEKFMDDGVEHEYLVVDGYLWTGQYPECQRVMENGNNQSMELDEKTLNAWWTKDNNGNYKFFIINEAVISKLCILGEDVEPCFEGAAITKTRFSLEELDAFKTKCFSLIDQMEEILNKGGKPMFTTFAVEIGDALWCSLFELVANRYPAEEGSGYCSQYTIEGIYEDGSQKFAILVDRSNGSYHRLNFSLTEESGFIAEYTLEDVTKTFVPVNTTPQFDPAQVQAYEAEYKKEPEEKEEEKEEPVEVEAKVEEPAEEQAEPVVDVEPKDQEPSDEKKYNLEEVSEYTELLQNYNDLQASVSAKETEYANKEAELNAAIAEKDAQISEYSAKIEELNAKLAEVSNESAKIDELNNQLAELNAFKLNVERKEKEKMIHETFYMLDDEYKKDVMDNIDTYSLDDIEAKLSIICVRNKISFSKDDESTNANGPVLYNLDEQDSDPTPAWFKLAYDVQQSKTN